MSVYLTNRRWFDDYQYQLAQECVDILNSYQLDFDFHYDGCRIPDLELLNIDNPRTLLIFTADNYVQQDFITTWNKKLEKISRLAHKDKKIIILSSVKNAELDHGGMSKLVFVNYGSDFLFSSKEWPQVEPQRNKNFDTDKHWISLNRQPKIHRTLCACTLLGLGITNGLLRADSSPTEKYSSWRKIYPRPVLLNNQQQQVLDLGYSLLPTVEQPYRDFWKVIGQNHDSGNFDIYLRSLYENSFVEIVNENNVFPKGIFITEKTMNPIYGFNFPIIIGNPGTIAYMEDLGFDMFRDIVDQSYDVEPDPLKRVYMAIELNQQLLLDKTLAIDLWKSNLGRFEKNITFAKDQMYKICHRRFLAEFKSTIEQLAI